MKIIAVDSGTTNTRAYLIENGKILASATRNVGSRDTAITGNRLKLELGVKDAIDDVLREVNMYEKPDAILASGMITSNMGICEIGHLPAPVSKETLMRAIQKQQIDTVNDMPIHFITGVKNAVEDHVHEQNYDMMRGEETETFGILAQVNETGPAVIILPGSHSKFVQIDDTQRILRCKTTLSGELAWAISKETILADSIDMNLRSGINKDEVLKGAAFSAQNGFSQACFKVRIMHVLEKTTVEERTNFMLGAIFYQDFLALKAMIEDENLNILIGGRKAFRDVFAYLLEKYAPVNWNVKYLDDKVVEQACPLGAWELWLKHKELV